jgi:uncharacterized cupin superfamily protein
MHMHYGAEEMFFVLSGPPVFRNQHGKETLAPGDFVFFPEGRTGDSLGLEASRSSRVAASRRVPSLP